jgi:hypothetical protein
MGDLEQIGGTPRPTRCNWIDIGYTAPRRQGAIPLEVVEVPQLGTSKSAKKTLEGYVERVARSSTSSNSRTRSVQSIAGGAADGVADPP